MWRERIKENEERSHRRDRNRFRVGERIHEDHHLRNRSVEGQRLNVFGHFLDRRVKDFALPLRKIDIFHCWRQFPFAGLIFGHHQPPDAREKPGHALNPAHAPRFHLLEWPHEHLVTAKRVRAVLLDYAVGSHDVPARLGHFLAVIAENDSLIHYTLKWLVLRKITEIEQNLVPETR